MFYNPNGKVLCSLLRQAWAKAKGGDQEKSMHLIAKIYIAIQSEMELFGTSKGCQKKAEALSVKFYTAKSYAEHSKQSKKIRDKGQKVSSVLHPYQGIDQNAVDMAMTAYQHVFDCFVNKLKKDLPENQTEHVSPWRFDLDENATDKMVLAFYKLRSAIAFADWIRSRKNRQNKALAINAPVELPPIQISAAIKKDIKSKVTNILRKKDSKFVNAWAAQIYSAAHRAGGHTKDIVKPLEVIFGVSSVQTVYNHLKPFNKMLKAKMGYEYDENKTEYGTIISEKDMLEYNGAILAVAERIVLKRGLIS